MRSPQHWLWIGLAALMLVALSGGVVVGLLQLVAPYLPLGYTITGCVGYNATGRFQVGVMWIAPHISSIPRGVFFWTQLGCLALPWLPSLPPVGSVMFPP